MRPAQLAELRAAHGHHIARAIEKGSQIAEWACSTCKATNKTVRPNKENCNKNGRWESAKLCTHCGKLSYVIVPITEPCKVYELPKISNR